METVKTEEYEEKLFFVGSLLCSSGRVPSKLDDKLMVQLGVKKLDDGSVVPDQSQTIDLDALIQTYKDQCGMELAKRLIATGQATEVDFRDDCKHSGDIRELPVSAQSRANAAVTAAANTAAMADELGVRADMDEEQLTAIIQQYIQKNPDKFKFEPKKEGAEE